MNYNNKNLRDALIEQVWNQHKNMITMKDIAEIFKVNVSSIYRILAETPAEEAQTIKDESYNDEKGR